MDAIVAATGISEAQLQRAKRLRSETGERIDIIVVRLGLLSEVDLAHAHAAAAGLALADVADLPPAPLLTDRLKLSFLREARALPLVETEDALTVAFADPTDHEILSAFRFLARRRIVPLVATPSDIERALDQLYGAASTENALPVETDPDETAVEDAERLRDLASDAPVIRLVNRWITAAVEAQASDIHIEPAEGALRVRFRLDGVLVERETQPVALHAAVVSRLKIMAKLDIAERRLTQDGRIGLAVRGREMDLRVSIIPSVRGESVVLRILDRGGVALDFAALGFDPESLARYLAVLERPHGVVLATGPTGSGKTTTLYTSLLRLRRPEVKILTIEDPVEYRLDGVNHTQVRPQIGLDFAATLRAFLRHDPDIIMVGEIRDQETARIAVQAALTGHLVLSSLHTNDAASSIVRLMDMGVEDYLITAVVNGIVAQRLVRQLCPHCRSPFTPSATLIDRLEIGALVRETEPVLFRAIGCERCHGTGYKGRQAIYEVLVMTERLRGLVMARAQATEIQRIAAEEGMESIYRNGARKALAGVTTMEEVVRVSSSV